MKKLLMILLTALILSGIGITVKAHSQIKAEKKPNALYETRGEINASTDLWEDGNSDTGWQTIDGNTYYLDSDGEMLTGWQFIDEVYYYFQDNGIMVTDLLTDAGYITRTGELDYSVSATSYNSGALLGEHLGVTNQDVLDVLKSHLNDTYYLSREYYIDWSADEVMNCEGFIWEVLNEAGADENEVYSLIGPFDEEREGFYNYVVRQDIPYTTYTGDDWDYLVDCIISDQIEPGDIVWMWDGPVDWNGLSTSLSPYHHVAFYAGDYFDKDKINCENSEYWQKTSDPKNRIWHSSGIMPPGMPEEGGNVTTVFYSGAQTEPFSITVFHLG